MRKWVWITIAIVICILATLIWFYFTAKDGFEKAEDRAIGWALELTSLTKVDHVEFFAGETDYTIVFGNNSEGEKLIVWVGDKIIHEKKADEGLSKSDIRKIVTDKYGKVNIVRITPAKFGELWAWEVFYKMQEEAGWRHYYDYYKFRNGEWLETYKLSLE